MLRVFLRGLQLNLLLAWHALRLVVRCSYLQTLDRGQIVGEVAADFFESAGGALLKLGQVLSTRVDLLPPSALKPMRRLQDRVRPLSGKQALAELRRCFAVPLESIFAGIECNAVASGSIAQVHRAQLQLSKEWVAIKLLRPGVRDLIRTDLVMLRLVVRFVAVLPFIRGIPIREAIDEAAHWLQAQTDFKHEAAMNAKLQATFASGGQVRIPRVLPEFCAGDVLVMEFIEGLKPLDAPIEASELFDRQSAIRIGLQALYKMMFTRGLVHCDLHSGNIFQGSDGRVVILDTGFFAELNPPLRQAFAEFFLAIAFGDGASAAEIVRRTALRVPPDMQQRLFESEMIDLIHSVTGLRAGEFVVARFVVELFAIQRRHMLRGSPGFTMAILALVVYEGLIRRHCPNLDFQREAVPYLMTSLVGAP